MTPGRPRYSSVSKNSLFIEILVFLSERCQSPMFHGNEVVANARCLDLRESVEKMKPFSQRKGLKPVSEVIQIDSMNSELRNSLWNTLTVELWLHGQSLNHRLIETAWDISSWTFTDYRVSFIRGDRQAVENLTVPFRQQRVIPRRCGTDVGIHEGTARHPRSRARHRIRPRGSSLR